VKGGNEDLARDFRERAYLEANTIHRKRKQRLYNDLLFYKLDFSFTEYTFFMHTLMHLLESMSGIREVGLLH